MLAAHPGRLGRAQPEAPPTGTLETLTSGINFLRLLLSSGPEGNLEDDKQRLDDLI